MMETNTKVALNLSNCIIGVSILAMPYCLKMCGLLLGALMLAMSCLLTRFTCHLLLKAALVTRKKSFEFIAFHTFGHAGKLAVEINIIGFMLGILISFYVVIGDLGPVIVSKTFGVDNGPQLRLVLLVFLAFGAALPLALLKDVEALVRISTLSVFFYSLLAFKAVAEAIPTMLSSEPWTDRLVLWQPSGLLQSLPIFSLALSCQTQLFEVLATLPDANLKQMNAVVKVAVYLCTGLYLTVGVFGYVAHVNEDITGNILLSFAPGLATDLIKLCFVLSVAMSFPLVVFPCRTSIHSLLFKRTTGPFDVGSGYIPETRFRAITVAIVVSTLLVGVACPNIETVLGFVGSTIGILTCVIFPALMFVHVVSKHTFERWGSQLVLVVGILLLASCTWENVNGGGGSGGGGLASDYSNSDLVAGGPDFPKPALPAKSDFDAPLLQDKSSLDVHPPPVAQSPTSSTSLGPGTKLDSAAADRGLTGWDCAQGPCSSNITDTHKRQEPPVPQEPDEGVPDGILIGNRPGADPVLNLIGLPKKKQVLRPQESPDAVPKSKDGEPAAVKQEESLAPNRQDQLPEAEQQVELLKESSALKQQEELLKKLEEQQIEQKKLLEEQREILQELKAHERSHNKEGQEENSKLSAAGGGAQGQAKSGQAPIKEELEVVMEVKPAQRSETRLKEETKDGPQNGPNPEIQSLDGGQRQEANLGLARQEKRLVGAPENVGGAEDARVPMGIGPAGDVKAPEDVGVLPAGMSNPDVDKRQVPRDVSNLQGNPSDYGVDSNPYLDAAKDQAETLRRVGIPKDSSHAKANVINLEVNPEVAAGWPPKDFPNVPMAGSVIRSEDNDTPVGAIRLAASNDTIVVPVAKTTGKAAPPPVGQPDIPANEELPGEKYESKKVGRDLKTELRLDLVDSVNPRSETAWKFLLSGSNLRRVLSLDNDQSVATGDREIPEETGYHDSR